VGLEDVVAHLVVEVLRLLGTQVDGRRLTVVARGHRVELDISRLSVRPPSMRRVMPGRRPLPSAASAWPGWPEALPVWADWSRWPELVPWPPAPASRPADLAWPALGRLEVALREVAVDGRVPFEVLDVTAGEVVLELAGSATLVARDLHLEVAASGAALQAWLPPDLRVRVREDGRLGVTRRGWGTLGEATAVLGVVDGRLQVALDAVEVRGVRLRAPKRWRRRVRLDPARYHPGLRFEEVEVARDSDRVRARLHLGEWREPVSFEQLGELRAHLARRAPVTLRSLLGG
jgi:hypothetical protein